MFGRNKGAFEPRLLLEKWTHTQGRKKGNAEEPLNWQYVLSPYLPLYPFVSVSLHPDLPSLPYREPTHKHTSE